MPETVRPGVEGLEGYPYLYLGSTGDHGTCSNLLGPNSWEGLRLRSRRGPKVMLFRTPQSILQAKRGSALQLKPISIFHPVLHQFVGCIKLW
jgi:hypothetical protein